MTNRLGAHLPLRFIASLCIIFSFWMPLGTYDDDLVFWKAFPAALATMLVGLGGLCVAPWLVLRLIALGVAVVALFILLPIGELQMGLAASGFWLALIGVGLFAWIIVADLSARQRMQRPS